MGKNSNNEDKQKSSTRKRNFAYMLYDDSCKSNWVNELDNQHIKYFYIKHDKDVNADGTSKKIHYHVMVMFDSPKSNDQAKEIADLIGAANGQFEAIKSAQGYARYLCHLDNPEKHQYDISEIHSGGGADYKKAIALPQDKYSILTDILVFCIDTDCSNLGTLLLYTSQCNSEWQKIIIDNIGIVKEMLKTVGWCGGEAIINELNDTDKMTQFANWDGNNSKTYGKLKKVFKQMNKQ